MTKVADEPEKYEKQPSKQHEEAVDLEKLEKEMKAAAAQLDFEKAAKIRDLIKELKGQKVI